MRPMPYICPAFSSNRRMRSMLRKAVSSSSLLKAVPFAREFCAFEGAALPRLAEVAAAMKSPFATPEAARATKITQLQGESEPPTTAPCQHESGEVTKRYKIRDSTISRATSCHASHHVPKPRQRHW